MGVSDEGIWGRAFQALVRHSQEAGVAGAEGTGRKVRVYGDHATAETLALTLGVGEGAIEGLKR